MQINLYHQNIEQQLTRELNVASNGLQIAVAWLTNQRLFSLLLTKLRQNIAVELILLNDSINFSPGGINFQKFIEMGGQLYISAEGKKLHHKFCIIDRQTIATGSYNWTYHAEHENHENLLVARGYPDLIQSLGEAFGVARADAYAVENLARFHEMHPPRSAQQDIQFYQADDAAWELLSNPAEAESFDRLDISQTSTDRKTELVSAYLQRLPEPLKDAVINKSAALKNMITRYHDWTSAELERHHGQLNKDLLCQNDRIIWTAAKIQAACFSPAQLSKIWQTAAISDLLGVLDAFQDNMDWKALVRNPKLPWTEDLLNRYADQIDWLWLHMANTSLYWSEDLVEMFADRLNWSRLSAAPNVAWSKQLIGRYTDKFDYRALSGNEALPWTKEIFEQCRGRLSFYVLSSNKGFCWSEELVIRDESRWDWKELSANTGMCWNETLIKKYHQKFYKSVLLDNEGIYWTSAMLDGLTEWLDASNINYINGWGALSIVDGAWKTPDILRRFASKFYLGYVCSNTRIDWQALIRSDLAERFLTYWGLPNTTRVGIVGLANNTAFPWSDGLVERYAKVIATNSSVLYELTGNEGFKKSLWFIDRYAAQINFGQLSWKKSVHWSDELLEKYGDRLDWKVLSANPAIPWQAKYLDKQDLDWTRIEQNPAIFDRVVQPALNPIVLEALLMEQIEVIP